MQIGIPKDISDQPIEWLAPEVKENVIDTLRKKGMVKIWDVVDRWNEVPKKHQWPIKKKLFYKALNVKQVQ